MILPDVGLWLAAMWARHPAHPRAAAWFDAQTESLVLCRVTQMSLLRVVTNPAVMRDDTLQRRAAWSVVDQLMADPRVVWSDEPPNLEPLWRAFSALPDKAHKLWADDYLAAFAQAGAHTLATLDQAMSRRHPSASTMLV